MSFSQHRDASFLNADEASAVETAVRTAVMSILKVFCGVNDKRSRCYEAKLAEAERENAALKFQLKAAEQELQTLRQISSHYKISAEVTFSASVQERGGGGGEEEEEEEEDVASFRSVSEVLKEEEEPFYESSLFIKSEKVTEGYSPLNSQYPCTENAQMCQQPAQFQTYGTNNNNNNYYQQQHNHSDPVLTGLERRRLTRYENVRRYRERIRADPEKYLAWKEKNHLRYLQNRKTINELPEPLKKLQRKAWREATRRHRAKKMAQAGPPAASTSQTPSL